MKSKCFGWWSVCCCLEVNQVLKTTCLLRNAALLEIGRDAETFSISPVGLRIRVELTNHESSQRYKPRNATLSNIYFILGDAGWTHGHGEASQGSSKQATKFCVTKLRNFFLINKFENCRPFSSKSFLGSYLIIWKGKIRAAGSLKNPAVNRKSFIRISHFRKLGKRSTRSSFKRVLEDADNWGTQTTPSLARRTHPKPFVSFRRI